MPVPEHAELLTGRLSLTPAFSAAGSGALSPVVVAAVGRTLDAWKSRSGLALTPDVGSSAGSPTGLIIECPQTTTTGPTLGEDESYTLNISSAQAVLKAQTVSGTIHGLATLQQLLTQDSAGWYLPAVAISDRPRFPWRGLLIDTARRWKGVDVIKHNLDGMALVKLNVFHFHLTDDQGFRIESKTHPELTAQGSDGLFYSQADIRTIIAYAAARGIRVVPEFDLPGHATSWLVSHPELASGPGPFLLERHWGVLNPVMDPTNEATYALLKDVFTEMAALFPDPYFHIGGDENNGKQWSGNPRIQAYIREHKLGDNPGLQTYFNQRAGAILTSLGKRMIGWDEILHPDLPRVDLIESWRGAESLAKAAAQGFSGILAHGYYLDSCGPASEYYPADPLPANSPLTPEQKQRVIGGEVSMWGEWVSAENVDSRIWPRAAAVAERLWSPADVRNPADMYRRLDIVDLRLAEVGTQQHAYVGPALNRLLGGNPAPAETESLSRFIELVQPASLHQRARQQVAEQLTPLTGVADVARPDSLVARNFASLVATYLAAPTLHTDDVEPIRSFLAGCAAAGRQVAGPLGERYPGIAPAAPLGFQLADAADVGLTALAALNSPRSEASLEPAKRLALIRLEADAEPHDGTYIAIIEPIRQLALAAGNPKTSP